MGTDIRMIAADAVCLRGKGTYGPFLVRSCQQASPDGKTLYFAADTALAIAFKETLSICEIAEGKTPSDAGGINQWPWPYRVIRRLRNDEDKGVGDTIKRLLGERGQRFQDWYARQTGKDCGCARRQSKLNNRYPYLPPAP